MKRSELFFSFICLPLDFLMIMLAAISAYYIRFAEFTVGIRPVIFNLPLGSYLKAALVISLLWLIIFAFAGLYNIKQRRLSQEINKVIFACSTGLMLIVILIFIRRELFDSRFIVLAGWILSILYVSIARTLIRLLQKILFNYEIGAHKIVLVGNSKTTENLIREFSIKKGLGFRVVKRLDDFSLESAKELDEFIENHEVDEIIQSDPNLTKTEVLRLYDYADEHHFNFKYAADLLDTKVLKTEVTEIAGIPIVEVKDTPLEGWGRIAKRIVDLIGSSILILIFSPIMLLASIAIKLDSRGPIFYLDYRTGQAGKKFLFFKFRSMLAHLCDGEGPSASEEGNKMLKQLEANAAMNTRSDEILHKIKEDPRITRVGKFIRRWSIDELPQLFNVLKGDISLVGPRPHMTLETAKYERHHKKVLTIKPGITGLAQISGRSDLSFEDEVKLDTYYIENWSLIFDFAILLRTPLAVLKPRKTE